MIPSSYALSIAVLCFILLRVDSSTMGDDPYSQLDETDDHYNSEHRRNVYYEFMRQRLAPWKVPYTPFRDQLHRYRDDRDLYSIRREAFGRKHHWDAFFGRR